MPIFKPKEPVTDEAQELLDALKATKLALDMARLDFEYAREPELIEASVYEVNALQARYNYLLRRAREEGALQHEVFKQLR